MPREKDYNKQLLIAELTAARQRIAELEAREASYLRAEQKLRAREAWGNTLLDSLPAGVLLVDPETHRIVDVNAYATKMIGRPKEELIGHPCHSYFCRGAKGSCPITDGCRKIENCEDVLLRSDGTAVPLHKTVTMVTHQGKKLLLESFIDISEQKRAQRTLELDEIRFEALYNLSQIINEPEQYILDYALEVCLRVTESTIGYICFVSDDETEMTVHAWSKGAMDQSAIQDHPTVFRVSESGLWGRRLGSVVRSSPMTMKLVSLNWESLADMCH